MTKSDFMEGVHLLQNNYGKTLTTEQLKLFYENLKDMSKDRYIANVKMNIKNNPFMPNVAQIRNETAKQFVDYEQRNYSKSDFSKFYANKGE